MYPDFLFQSEVQASKLISIIFWNQYENSDMNEFMVRKINFYICFLFSQIIIEMMILT